jgi:hypothetical protein
MIGLNNKFLLSGMLISIPKKNMRSKIPISPKAARSAGSEKIPVTCGPRIIPVNT